jgi:hypothetical protein
MGFLFIIYFCGCVVSSLSQRTEESIKSFCAPFKPGSEKCEILINLEQLQKDCGEVCNTTVKPVSSGKHYDVIKKNFDCLNLFESPTIDNREKEAITQNKKPLSYQDLPKRIRDLYTYQVSMITTFFLRR